MNPATPLRFIVVDDHTLIREGMHLFLTAEYPGCTIELTPNGVEAVDRCNNSTYDLVLLDVCMPVMDGFETTAALLHLNQDIKIVAFSFFNDAESIGRLMHAGVRGYFVKDAPSSVMKEVIDTVINGGYRFANHRLEDLLKSKSTEARELIGTHLTNREKEVLVLICNEKSTKQIAMQLNISPRTVENHRQHLYDKTHAHNIAGLVRYAQREGIL